MNQVHEILKEDFDYNLSRYSALSVMVLSYVLTNSDDYADVDECHAYRVEAAAAYLANNMCLLPSEVEMPSNPDLEAFFLLFAAEYLSDLHSYP